MRKKASVTLIAVLLVAAGLLIGQARRGYLDTSFFKSEPLAKDSGEQDILNVLGLRHIQQHRNA